MRRREKDEDAPAADAAGHETSSDLEIEKRWMLLVRTDLESFELFYDKYRRPVHAFIRHRVGDPEVAEDLLSETFLEAVDGLWRFRFQGVTFGAWLFRLASRRIAKHYARLARRQEENFVAEVHDATVPAVAQGGLEREQDRELLAGAINRLEQIDQDIVVLYYWEHFSLAQIAVVVGLNQVRTKARLHRARRKLARLLESPAKRDCLSQEGRRALDAMRLDMGRLRLLDGGDERVET